MTKNRTKTLIFTTFDTSKLKKIDDYERIYSVNPLHLRIDHANGYIEEKNGNKYLIFDSVDENKEVLKKYTDVWNGIKNKIKEVRDSGCDYEKDYMKIKFNSEDNLPLNKSLKFHAMTIIIRCVFSEGGKPQLCFRSCFVWIIKMLQYQKIDVSEGTDVSKTGESKEC